MSVTMLAPIAETSAMSWARHNSAPDLRTMDAPRAGSEGVRRSGTPITYVCLSCRAPIAADASIVARTGFRGYKGKAALFASTLNTSLAAPSILLMDTGAHTVQECACARCGAYLGWRVARAHEPSEQWKERRFLLELTLLAESSPAPSPASSPELLADAEDIPTPVRLTPPTPVSEPPTPVSSVPTASASSSTPHATLRPLPLPVKLEEPAPLRPLPRPRSRPSSSDGPTPATSLAERLAQKGHRRSATDTPSGGAGVAGGVMGMGVRGRPLGPRSLTPTLGARTLSVYSQV